HPDAGVGRTGRQRQGAVPLEPAGAGRVMDEIARLPVPGGRSGARAAGGWVTRPRHIALSPLGGLAIAAGVAALALVLSGGRPGSAPPAEDTPREFEFVVVAPRAASVSLVGDFNDWDAA